MAEAMRFHARHPPEFWAEAVAAANVIRNESPTTALDGTSGEGKCPEEIRGGDRMLPDGVFGDADVGLSYPNNYAASSVHERNKQSSRDMPADRKDTNYGTQWRTKNSLITVIFDESFFCWIQSETRVDKYEPIEFLQLIGCSGEHKDKKKRKPPNG